MMVKYEDATSASVPISWRTRLEHCFGLDLSQHRVLIGQAVDNALGCAAALGQALDQSTILLSSQLSSLPEHCQFLLLAHEVAHTMQMAKGGSDGISALEDEAWKAARSALQGRRHRIVGRTRQPLYAKGLIDSTVPPGALPYYIMSQLEPDTVNSTPIVEHPELVQSMTLTTLLDAILKAFSQRDFEGPDLLLVAHGKPDWGLTMHVVSNGVQKAGTVVLKELMSADSSATMAKKISGGGDPKISGKVVDSLIDKMKQVRALNLGLVMFRGCSIGAQMDNLVTLQQFLGAWRVSAPQVRSSFGFTHPNVHPISEREWEHWLLTHPGSSSLVGLGGQGFVISRVGDRTFSIADSTAIVSLWMNSNLPALHTPYSYTGGQFPIHSLNLGPPRPLVFPLDTDYSRNIVATT